MHEFSTWLVQCHHFFVFAFRYFKEFHITSSIVTFKFDMTMLQLYQFKLSPFPEGIGRFLLQIHYVNNDFMSSISACEFSKLVCRVLFSSSSSLYFRSTF